jgi:signal transduction histidine kinase
MTFHRPTRGGRAGTTVDPVNLLRRLLTHQLRPVDLLVLDALSALVAAAVCVSAALAAPPGGPREPAWLSVLVAVLIGLPLVRRHRWPVMVAAAVTAASAVALVTGVVPDFAAAGPACALAIALYAVGLLVPERRSILTAAGCLAGMAVVLAAVANGLWDGTGAVLYATVMVAPAWLIGWMVRERRASAARYRAQLRHEAATEERLRVARDLHDVVGHTMTLIAVKASVAVHVAAERPEAALEALRVIEATSRDALLDTRRLLGMLRDEEPAPRPAELHALADRASAAGVEVTLELPPDAFDRQAMPESVARSVHRILQEALTNVVKHAAPARCRASVTVGPAEVRIDIVDDGRRPAGPVRPGHGLIGMRERVALHGGEFTAGPRPEGGFGVSVRMPTTVGTSGESDRPAERRVLS